MRSIVVPVNFSANSANAARYAADPGMAIGADIHLVHVFQIPASVPVVPMPESVFKELRDSGIEMLAGLPQTAKFHAVRKIVVACDKEDIDSGMPATLPFLKELSELLGARLEVLHVRTDGEESAAKVEEGISDYLEGAWGRLGDGLPEESQYAGIPPQPVQTDRKALCSAGDECA